MSFRGTYETLLRWLLTCPTELNERTGERIFVGPHAFSFNVDLRFRLMPFCGIRRTFPRTAAAEVAWFLKGDKDVSFIRQYAPIWDKFVEDDGSTVAGAYGHRWRRHFGRDQVSDAVAALRANSTDRRVVVMAWDPGQDGLGRPSKNVPCPIGFTLSIVGGRLNSTIVLRSSDVFVGLPYDVMGHALLMAAVAASVGVDLGHMHVTLAHPHVYGVHENMAHMALASMPSDETAELPYWTTWQVEANPHGYVDHVRELFADVRQPDYHCRPEVVQ